MMDENRILQRISDAEPFAINIINQTQVSIDQSRSSSFTIATGNTFSNTGTAIDRDFANYGIPLSAYSAAAAQYPPYCSTSE